MIALDSHIETIARRLLGEPNPKFGTHDQWRYGNKGSLSIEITGEKRGQWFDHETDVGGGPFAFIKKYAGLDDAGARQWIADELGIKDDPPKYTRQILYNYVSEDSTLLFQVVRVPATPKREKFFYQRQPDGKGGWNETVLYSFTGGADGGKKRQDEIDDGWCAARALPPRSPRRRQKERQRAPAAGLYMRG